MLKKQHLSGSRFISEPRLRFFPFFATERRIHQNDIMKYGGTLEETAISLSAGQCIAVPDVRLIDVVENQVRKPDGIDRVVLLTAVKGCVL